MGLRKCSNFRTAIFNCLMHMCQLYRSFINIISTWKHNQEPTKQTHRLPPISRNYSLHKLIHSTVTSQYINSLSPNSIILQPPPPVTPEEPPNTQLDRIQHSRLRCSQHPSLPMDTCLKSGTGEELTPTQGNMFRSSVLPAACGRRCQVPGFSVTRG